MMKKDFGDTHDRALHCSAEKSSLLTLEGDYRLTQGAVTASALAPHQSKLNMGLFNAIDEFFTGPAAEVEMMSASEQREQAQRLNELQDEEETFGLTEKSSANIRQLSSSSNSSSGNDSNDSGGSVKLLLALIGGFVAIYLTYEYGVGNGVKVSSSDGLCPTHLVAVPQSENSVLPRRARPIN